MDGMSKQTMVIRDKQVAVTGFLPPELRLVDWIDLLIKSAKNDGKDEVLQKFDDACDSLTEETP